MNDSRETTLRAFIRDHVVVLADDWEIYARTLLAPGRELDREAVRDSADRLLVAIADHMLALAEDASRPDMQRQPGGKRCSHITTYARTHAESRLSHGFTLSQVVDEYGTLRQNVVRRWRAAYPDASISLDELMRFDRSIDQALLDSGAWYHARLAEARDLFLGVLGHDLRTPLGAITLSVEVLKREAVAPHIVERLATRMSSSAKRMRVLIDDLLEFTRMRLGAGLPVRAAPMHLRDVLHRVIDEMTALHPGVVIQLHLQEPLDGEWDGERLSQLASNLLDNAVRHGDRKMPIVVQARFDDDRLVVEVCNHGRPIPPETLAHIFEPFRSGTVDGNASEVEHFGLGLYICLEIARAHGGTIDVESNAAEGTRFTVRLPRIVKSSVGTDAPLANTDNIVALR